jgi:hypothetical protein
MVKTVFTRKIIDCSMRKISHLDADEIIGLQLERIHTGANFSGISIAFLSVKCL